MTVEKTGQTISVFYYAYDDENGVYQLTDDEQMPDALAVEIPFVNDGESEVVPMTKCDDAGMLWEAQIDKAYIGADMQIVNNADGIATFILTVPDKSGMTYFGSSDRWVEPTEEEEPAGEEESTANEIPAEPSGQTPDIWVWLIPVAVIVIAAVAVIVLRDRKKAE